MGMKKNQKFVFFALAPTGKGLSGSDRIFIELAREWSKTLPVTIYTTSEGIEMVKRQNLKGKYLEVVMVEQSTLPSNFLMKYLYKVVLGLKLGLTLPFTVYRLPNTYLYSSSDFWMDVFPAVILKIRFNKVKWIATWFQTAPNPLRGFEEQRTKSKGQRMKTYKFPAFLYWFSQLISKPLISKYADKIIVNNEDEKKQFPENTKRGDTIVLLGAVPLDSIKEWKSGRGGVEVKKIYDSVFQGRFHPQKGVVEL